ncbi:MAG: universal stress protein [Mongoliibacter sp.]|uniref:universal stress protein n=1 Tax=Mongoliibacter sp. TaxID=2022438 RepID=UPI0012F1F809|nr:universal stress protein [Mongoliibacter sp.]TVP51112.1 MAG: universal stress protein [Mongoliibacter sp.]
MAIKLIIPIDFSPYSKEQLRLAKSWQTLYNVDLLILHKINLLFPSLSSADLRLKMEYELKRDAKNKVNDFLEKAGLDINLPTQIFTESVVEFIKNSKHVNPQDIIVVGMKGAGMVSRILIGSTTIQLIDELKHLIIGVPLELKELYPEKLMVGIHFKSGFNKQSFSSLLELIATSLRFVEFVSVLKNEEDRSKTESFLQEVQEQFISKIETEFKVFDGSHALESLKQFYLDLDHSFMVVQKGSRSFSDQILRKFMVNELVYKSFAPLIILP